MLTSFFSSQLLRSLPALVLVFSRTRSSAAVDVTAAAAIHLYSARSKARLLEDSDSQFPPSKLIKICFPSANICTYDVVPNTFCSSFNRCISVSCLCLCHADALRSALSPMFFLAFRCALKTCKIHSVAELIASSYAYTSFFICSRVISHISCSYSLLWSGSVTVSQSGMPRPARNSCQKKNKNESITKEMMFQPCAILTSSFVYPELCREQDRPAQMALWVERDRLLGVAQD